MTWLDEFLALPHPGPTLEARAAAPWDPTLEALCCTHPEAARDLREERAAILEHCARLPRNEAEHRAVLS